MTARTIIGIDPGSRFLGWGIIQENGSSFFRVKSGVIKTPASLQLPQKLEFIGRNLEEIIAQYQPTHAAIESIFVSKNVHSALILGHARGTAMYTLARAGLEVTEIASREVKLAVTGHGSALKEEVGRMVKLLLSLKEIPQEDEADALGVALAHSRSAASLNIIA